MKASKPTKGVKPAKGKNQAKSASTTPKKPKGSAQPSTPNI